MFRNIIYKPTYKCNLGCLYCYKSMNREKMLDESTWKPFETLEKLIDMITPYENKFRLCFHGGEFTTLGYKKMAKMFDIVKKSPNVDHITMQSNLIALNSNIISVLKDYDVSVGASYDGPRSFRYSKNGKDMSLHIRQKIIDLKKANINVGFLGQLLPICSIKELVDDFVDLNVPFEIRPPMSFDCGIEEYRKLGYENRLEYYMDWLNTGIPELAKRGKLTDRSVKSMVSSIFPEEVKTKEILCSNGPCVFSWQLLTVDGDGTALPCNIIGRKYTLGNIWENTFEEMLNSPKVVELGKRYSMLAEKNCQKCFAKMACYGGCIGDLQYQLKREYLEYNYLAEIENSVPSKCDETRMLWLYVVNMSANNKELFDFYLGS